MGGGKTITKEQEIIEKLTNEEKINFNTLVRKFKKEGTENFIVTKKEYIETVLNMLKEKDKQIDLMADFINKTGAERRVFSCTFRKNDECNENGCRYCIKQYFKEISEERKEEC